MEVRNVIATSAPASASAKAAALPSRRAAPVIKTALPESGFPALEALAVLAMDIRIVTAVTTGFTKSDQRIFLPRGLLPVPSPLPENHTLATGNDPTIANL